MLLARGTDGTVRAFANTCRHRGHELLGIGEETTRRTVLCPYHAWTYDLDGTLRVAPGFREHTDFRPGEHGLVELPLESWHGFLFVNGSGDAPPFAEHVGALDDLVAPYRPERLVPLVSHDYDLDCNWKVILENYHECYHCPLIHPELCQVSPPASGDNFELDGAWVGGTMDLKDHAATMSLDGHSDGVPIPGLDGERLRTVAYLGLFPNLLLSLHPDYVMTHLVEPLAADRSHVICTWYFPPEATEQPGFDPGYAVDFWDTDQPPGLVGVRVGAAGHDLPPLPARPPGPGRGRRLPRGDDDRPRLPGRAPERPAPGHRHRPDPGAVPGQVGVDSQPGLGQGGRQRHVVEPPAVNVWVQHPFARPGTRPWPRAARARAGRGRAAGR